MNTDNTPKTDKISDETSAKVLRCHIEEASRRGDDGTVCSLLLALLILAVMLLVIWFMK